MTAPTPEAWLALRHDTASAMAQAFRETLASPPSPDHWQTGVLAGAARLADSKRAMAAAVTGYIAQVDAQALWEATATEVPAALLALSRSLAIAAAARQSQPALSTELLASVDAVCEVWGRLVRNLAGGLLYVTQEDEDPRILSQFIRQGVGISGVRPSETEDGLRLDASPEPAEKLALFFGV